MYSVVMMIALSGGAQTPDWGWGCCGGCNCGCWGGGCCGWRWHCGCCGWRPLFHRWHCCGCCGGCVGCVGCAGCVGCVGPAMPVMPGTAPAPAKTFFPSDVSQNGETPNVFVNYQPKETKETAKSATVLVNLPAGARLTFNGWTSENQSTTRRFRTPALEPGQEYAYTLRAEIVRGGRVVVQNHEVVVRAGQQTRVNIEFPSVVLTQHQEQ